MTHTKSGAAWVSVASNALLIAAKIGLTYTVPFSVSTYSALAANRLHGG